jgi:3-oxoadipate enol-lactonase
VRAPDLVPGGPPATQLARWAAQLAQQLAAAGGGPAHVVGASLGASVALRLACDAPHLVASLTRDSAQLGGPPPPLPLRRAGRILAVLAARLPMPLIAPALLSQFTAYQGADRAAVRADMLRLGLTGLMGQLGAQLAHDLCADAPRIAAPALLLAGERDPLTRAGAHRALHAALHGAQLLVVPGAGHVTFLRHLAALQDALPRFLDQLA